VAAQGGVGGTFSKIDHSVTVIQVETKLDMGSHTFKAQARNSSSGRCSFVFKEQMMGQA
jgi:hypothetical protein